MNRGRPTIFTSAKASMSAVVPHLKRVAKVLVLFLSCALAQAQSTDPYTIGPVPLWVIAPATAPTNVTRAVETGQSVRLFDQQVNVPERAYYRAYVREIHNESGVQDGSRINMYFDPTYQKLTIHNILIRRGSNILERLDREKIKVIQQERDLERYIYDGTVSVLLFLEDVRVGDLIEFAFTIHGFNPIFGDRFATVFSTQWTVPVDSQRFRLLWPQGRALGYASYGRSLRPVIDQSGGMIDHVWQDWNLPPVRHEGDVPSWFYVYPWVQLSEFTSWADVARWAAALYPKPGELSAELKQKIGEWKRSPVDRVTAALNFVQQEVRYLGFEFGANSHRPSDPSAVYSRRFGDCKDKVYLLCTILKELGTEATPALVNTFYRGKITEWLPSPLAFDHVITQVKVGGKTLYLDPTISHQGGPATERFLADYQACLLIRNDTTDLTAVPRPNQGLPLTTITEQFFVRATNEPAAFSVTTVYNGAAADRVRSTFRNNAKGELEKEFLNYYGRRYPQIKATRALQTSDDPARNIFTTREWYDIHAFWTLSEDQRTYHARFYPVYTGDQIYKPTTQLRTTPLAIDHPRRVIQRTEVTLPDAWPTDNGQQTIASKATVLREKHSCIRSNLVLEYEFESTTNSIATSDVPAYLQDVDRMENALGYSLTWRNAFGPGGQMNWPMLLAGGLFGMAASVGAFRVYRLRLKTPPVLHEILPMDQQLTGISGWLILVAIGMLVSFLRIAKDFVSTWPAYSVESWTALTTRGGESYHFLWGPYLSWALLANITMLILVVLTIVLFFQRRRIFPRMFIGYMAFGAVVSVIDVTVTQLLPTVNTAATDANAGADLARVFIGCGIWIPYMLMSRRVRNTFVR